MNLKITSSFRVSQKFPYQILATTRPVQDACSREREREREKGLEGRWSREHKDTISFIGFFGYGWNLIARLQRLFFSSICIPPLKRVASPGGWDTNDEWRVGSKVTVYRFRRLYLSLSLPLGNWHVSIMYLEYWHLWTILNFTQIFIQSWALINYSLKK